MIDSHCHLADARFDGVREPVLRRAHSAGVEHIIVPTAQPSEWNVLSAQASSVYTPGISVAGGIHPWYAPQHIPREAMVSAAGQWIAIGECGLDFTTRGAPKAWQLDVFRWQLHLAQQFQLPVIIHACKSLDVILDELQHFKQLRIIIHGFRSSKAQLERLLTLDCYFGIGRNIHRSEATKLHAIIRQLPLGRIMLESDAPDQLPASRHSAAYNEPAFLIDTAQALADVLKMPTEALIAYTQKNTKTCFDLLVP